MVIASWHWFSLVGASKSAAQVEIRSNAMAAGKAGKSDGIQPLTGEGTVADAVESGDGGEEF